MERKMVDFIKEQYPPGTRIRLNSMDDPYAPILPGTEGEVDFVDDEGQIFMKWDNGRTLPLAPGEDSFTVLPPKLSTLKLYMPLTADLYERNEYGDFDDSSTLLEGSELRGYQDQITAALVKNRMPEETERGLMHWYDEADSVDRKVRSAVFTVEKRDRQLWGVAECRVAGELSDTELETLKQYLTGQASDGWCEGFEQREISVDDGGELYVHFWNSDEWSIQTEQELFAPKLVEGLSWWAQELPSDEEYAEARRTLDAVGWQVDYIITHCAPTSIALMGSRHNEADRLTDFLQEVRERARYHYWLFGHYHDNRAIDEKHILLWEQIVRVI